MLIKPRNTGKTRNKSTRCVDEPLAAHQTLCAGFSRNWLVVLGIEAARISPCLLMGLPGLAYASGFQAVWLALGWILGVYGNWRLVADRALRTDSGVDAALGEGRVDENRSWDLPDYFARRFAAKSKRLRVMTLFFMLIFSSFYVSAGLVAAGRLWQVWLGWDYLLALAWTIVAVLCGFCASVRLQRGLVLVGAALMLVALLLTAIVSVYANGGLEGVANSLEALNPALLSPWRQADGEPLTVIGILALLSWGLAVPVQSPMQAQWMPMSRPLLVVCGLGLGIMMVAALLIGFTGIGVLHMPLYGVDSEKVFIYLFMQCFAAPWTVIGLSGVFIVIVGTVGAVLRHLASVLTWHLSQLSMRANQTFAIECGLLALACGIAAMQPQASVLALLGHAWAGFGAALGVPLWLALYWRGITGAAVQAGMLLGSCAVLLWVGLQGSSFNVYELLSSVACATLAVWLVSFFDPDQWEDDP